MHILELNFRSGKANIRHTLYRTRERATKCCGNSSPYEISPMTNRMWCEQHSRSNIRIARHACLCEKAYTRSARLKMWEGYPIRYGFVRFEIRSCDFSNITEFLPRWLVDCHTLYIGAFAIRKIVEDEKNGRSIPCVCENECARADVANNISCGGWCWSWWLAADTGARYSEHRTLTCHLYLCAKSYEHVYAFVSHFQFAELHTHAMTATTAMSLNFSPIFAWMLFMTWL